MHAEGDYLGGEVFDGDALDAGAAEGGGGPLGAGLAQNDQFDLEVAELLYVLEGGHLVTHVHSVYKAGADELMQLFAGLFVFLLSLHDLQE